MLLAPKEIHFKNDGWGIAAVVYTKSHLQARVIPIPISFGTFVKDLAELAFSKGISSDHFTLEDIHPQKIRFNYDKVVSEQLTEQFETLTPVSDSESLCQLIEVIEVAYDIGALNDQGKFEDPYDSFKVKLQYTPYDLQFLFRFWIDICSNWNKAIKRDVEQLGLFTSNELAELASCRTKVLQLKPNVSEDVNIDDYYYRPEQLVSNTGKPLTGGALLAKKRALARDGDAVKLADLSDNPNTVSAS